MCVGARWCAWAAAAATSPCSSGGHANPCPRIVVRPWNIPGVRQWHGQWAAYVLLHLVPRYWPGNTVLPYLQQESSLRGGIRLDSCDVISTAGNLGMAIITLGRLFFMLSCRLTPIDAPSVQHGWREGNDAACALAESYHSSGVGSEALWTMLLVSFRCEDTYHMTSPDPRFGENQAYPWSLVCGLPLTSFLAELATCLDVGPTPDPTPCLVCIRVELLRLGDEGTLALRYRQCYHILLHSLQKIASQLSLVPAELFYLSFKF
jgi:hypothetical protein